MSAMASGGMSFEEKRNALEELADEMTAGEMPLDRALDAYEKGMALAKDLNAQLNEAEKRILEVSGGKLTPMEVEEDG